MSDGHYRLPPPSYNQVLQQEVCEKRINNVANSLYPSLREAMEQFPGSTDKKSVFKRLVAKHNAENPSATLKIEDGNAASATAPVSEGVKTILSDTTYRVSPESLLVKREHAERFKEQKIVIISALTENVELLNEVISAAKMSTVEKYFSTELKQAVDRIFANKDVPPYRPRDEIRGIHDLLELVENTKELSGLLKFFEDQGVIPKPTQCEGDRRESQRARVRSLDSTFQATTQYEIRCKIL